MVVRTQLGLRADQAWVISVEGDPKSLVREGIRVTPAEAIVLDERQLQQAIDVRRQLGLRADRSWVQAVLADARSVSRNLAVLVVMSPEEALAWDARVNSRSDISRALQAYVRPFQREFAGWFFADNETKVVALFTSGIDVHGAALAALIDPALAETEARQAQWSLTQLAEYRDKVWDEEAWLADRGVSLTGVVEDIPNNSVILEFDIPNPEANAGLAAQIFAHFDSSEWMALKPSVDAIAWLGTGSLIVEVVDSSGDAAVGFTCQVTPDVFGGAGDFAITDSDGAGVCSWDGTRQIAATSYTVEVRRRLDGPILGSQRVLVPRDGIVKLRLQIADVAA